MKVKIKIKEVVFERNIISYTQIACPDLTHISWTGTNQNWKVSFFAACKIEDIDQEVLCAFIIIKDITACVIDREFMITDIKF